MADKHYRSGHDGYVSEFTHFMDRFLDKHPEVIDDQRRGWYLYWDHKVDLKALEQAEQDVLPMDGYPYFAWHADGDRHRPDQHH